MDARLQRRVQRYGWDKASGVYEPGWREQLAPAHAKVLELAALRPGERVVETACGTGLVTLLAAEAVGPTGRIEATDLSRVMVERLQERSANLGLEGRVNARRMGAEALDFEDGAFDAALCALGLMYVPDPLAALREMHRVLAPGGRAVAAVWGDRRHCGWAGIFPVVDARVETEVCPLFFALGTDGSLERHFERAGFTDLRSERFSTWLEYPDERAALSAAFEGGPVALAYDRFADDVRVEAHRDYLETIASFRDGDGYRIPGEFVVVRGEQSSIHR
jgi:ubiquinone/menaquinone biosynthesis C-methylase UbiE